MSLSILFQTTTHRILPCLFMILGLSAQAFASEWIGILAPAHAVDLAANLDGRLQQIQVDVGDQVQEGELLATIEARVLEEDLPIARAALASAEAELTNAESQLQHAESRYQRLQRAGQAIAREELDNAAAELSSAHSAKAVSAARVAEKKGAIERLQTSLKRSEVRAPFNGIISLKYLEAGTLVADKTPLFRLMANDDLVVRFAVPPNQTGSLQVGTPVEVILNQPQTATPHQGHSGQVSWIAPVVDIASQMVFVEATLNAGANQLRAGMDAWVRLAHAELANESQQLISGGD